MFLFFSSNKSTPSKPGWCHLSIKRSCFFFHKNGNRNQTRLSNKKWTEIPSQSSWILGANKNRANIVVPITKTETNLGHLGRSNKKKEHKNTEWCIFFSLNQHPVTDQYFFSVPLHMTEWPTNQEKRQKWTKKNKHAHKVRAKRRKQTESRRRRNRKKTGKNKRKIYRKKPLRSIDLIRDQIWWRPSGQRRRFSGPQKASFFFWCFLL